MPVQLSPGVVTTERDYTASIPATSASSAAFAGVFSWGPVEDPYLITNEAQLTKYFGRPNDDNFHSFFTAASFLAYSSSLLVARADSNGLRNAVAELSGSVTSVDVVEDASSTFSAPPDLVISSPQSGNSGIRAKATAYLKATSVAKVEVSEEGRGSGFTDVPTLKVSGGGIDDDSANHATLTAVLVGTEIKEITATGGSGYTESSTTVTIGKEWAANTAYTVNEQVFNGDNLYTVTTAGMSGAAESAPVETDAETEEISGGAGFTYAGVAAKATASVGGDDDEITAINLDEAGSGYISIPAVTITDTSDGGSGAEATAFLVGTEIDSVTVDTGGSGYTSLPTVSVDEAKGGSGAAFTVELTPAVVEKVVITEKGSGYTEATLQKPLDLTGITFNVKIDSGIKIKNYDDYADNDKAQKEYGEWAARYPGKLGNSIKVSMADAGAYDKWEYKNFFDAAPDTSESVRRKNSANAEVELNDELHIIVIDEDGLITGEKNTVLERYSFVSKASDAKKEDGTNNYYKEVINTRSNYIYWLGHTEENRETNGDDWGIAAKEADGTYGFKKLTKAVERKLKGGEDDYDVTSGDLQNAWDLFKDAEKYDIGLIPTGKINSTVGKYILNNIAEKRKDCVVCLSPVDDASSPKDTKIIVGTNDDNLNLITKYIGYYNSTSYGFMDSGAKKMYDRYNDVRRYVMLNGDIAGLMARTDSTNDPWWSPAGYNRGFIKNIEGLAFSPSDQTHRDVLYKNNINPVIKDAEGYLLFGDKTMQRKPSAFDRINVRRLFIVLRKAISRDAKYKLFEQNDQFTRSQFVSRIEPFLRQVQGRRGVTDYLIVCDHTNNPPEVEDNGEFVADILVKPTRSINFIKLNFVATASSVEFREVIGA